MRSFLLRDPEALALSLLVLLVGAGVAAGLRCPRRRGGGEAAISGEDQEVVTTWPHLVRLELMASLAVLLLVSWWAILLEVPLGPRANPSVTPAIAKAPWFFVGVQEMLHYFDAWLAGAVLPATMVLGLCALPYLDAPGPADRAQGRGGRMASLVLLALALFWLLPTLFGLFFRGENGSLQPVWRAALSPTTSGAARVVPSLGQWLGLGPAGQHLVGGGLCLAPIVLLLILWLRLRRREWARRVGPGRFIVTGGLLAVLLGVAVKVMLVSVFGVRYLWMTPWFRI